MLNLNTLRQQQIPVMTEYRAQIPFHILAKPIGPACNLACRYCYYPQGETPVEKMNESTLEVLFVAILRRNLPVRVKLILSGKAVNRF